MLLVWLFVLILAAVGAVALKGPTNDTFSVPGTESERALSLLDMRFPGTGGAVARIVFAAPAGHTLTEPRYRGLIGLTVAQARAVPQTVGGTRAFLGSLQLSHDGRVAFADLHFGLDPAGMQVSLASPASASPLTHQGNRFVKAKAQQLGADQDTPAIGEQVGDGCFESASPGNREAQILGRIVQQIREHFCAGSGQPFNFVDDQKNIE